MNPEDIAKSNATGNNTSIAGNDEIDVNVIQQFKMIVIVILLILIGSLGFFVYNLIKCYLPKWRGKMKVEEDDEKCDLKTVKAVSIV